MLRKEDLEVAVKNNLSIVDSILAKYGHYLDLPFLGAKIKAKLRENWHIIQYYLGNVNNAIKLMEESNPEIREVLRDPKIVEYLNREIYKLYLWLYDFTWNQ